MPYGPVVTAMHTPGRKAFLVVNHWLAAPLIRAGGGPLLTTPVAGSVLLLRTTGRKSGLPRNSYRIGKGDCRGEDPALRQESRNALEKDPNFRVRISAW